MGIMAKKMITSELISAIRAWKDTEHLTYEAIGEIAGVKHSSVCQWFSGKTASMYESTYNRLLPHIQKYLPTDYKPIENKGAMILNNGGTNYGNAVSGYCLSIVLKKINASDKLTPEEKVKVTNVLLED